MSAISRLKKLVEQLTGTHIYREMPRGIDVFHDLAKRVRGYRADVVFDIGANVGQSALQFLANLPDAHIYCFEPVSDTFRTLQTNLNGRNRVECFQLAFGSSSNTGEMILQGNSEMHFLLGQSSESPEEAGVQTETVEVVSLDDFCSSRNVDHISYLKIDTEGGDLDVLNGAQRMLIEQRVAFVQVEAGMNPTNTRHVPFESLKALLESHGYFLFGIYEQVNERPTAKPHLRRTNPVFISRRLVEND
jgi:FkbM family methyltransferase